MFHERGKILQCSKVMCLTISERHEVEIVRILGSDGKEKAKTII